jgi:uncharacterized protein (TIGR02246 family)
MSTQPTQAKNVSNPEEAQVIALYQNLINAWNQRDAAAFAALFAEDGAIVGFDGSQMYGPAEINATLHQIFTDHITPPYITKVKGIRFLSSEVAILNAISGMVPPGKSELEPGLNTVQRLVAIRHNGKWYIALFQNTPAQLHGRPDLVQQMTEELCKK